MKDENKHANKFPNEIPSQTSQIKNGELNSGYEYERLIPAYFALKFLLDPRVKSFKFEINSSPYTKFDDLVIQILYKNEEKEYFFLQLKHREKEKATVDARKEFSRRDNRNKPKPFNISQYIKGYEEHTKKCEFNHKFVLFTNVTFLNIESLEDFETTTPKDPFQLDLFNVNSILQFKKVEKQNVNCKNFYFIYAQKNVREVEAEIISIFKKRFRVSESTAKEYMYFFRDVHTKHYCDTKLTSDAIILNLVKILLTNLTIKFPLSKDHDSKISLLEAAVKQFDLTILTEVNEACKFNVLDDLEQFQEKAEKLKFLKKGENCSQDIPREFLCFLLEKPLCLQISKSEQIETVKSVLPILQALEERRVNLVLVGEDLHKHFGEWKTFRNLKDLKQDRLYSEFLKILKVSVQGRELHSLEQLKNQFGLTFDDVISTDEILKCLHQPDNKLSIGKTTSNLPNNHIPKRLRKIELTLDNLRGLYETNTTIIYCGGHSRELQQILFEKNLTTMNICTSLEQFRKNKSKFSNSMLIITDDEFLEEEEENEDEDILHLKLTDGNNLEWCESKISTRNPIIFKNNVNLLLGNSGSGKTVMLNYLAQNCPLDYWVVFTPLDEVSSLFSDCFDYKTVLDHLLKETIAGSNDKEIIERFLKNKKIVFLFDGINRLNGNVRQNAMKMIQMIAEQGFKIWISCRKNLQYFVESYLSVPLLYYQVDTFKRKNQLELIRKTLSLSDANEFIGKFIRNDTIQFKEILKNPLILTLVLENPNVLKDVNNFGICKLYELLFEKKVEYFFKKKGIEKDVVEKIRIVIEIFQDYYNKGCQRLALQCCLETSIFESLNVQPEAKFLEMIQDNDCLGFIKNYQDKNFSFEHYSFAEYFAAMWLFENFKNVPQMETFFFQTEYKEIRRFFEAKLAEDCPLHLAVLNQNLKDVKQFAHLKNQKDKGGRTALHLAASLGPIHKILQKDQTKLSSSTYTQQNASQQQQIFDYLVELGCDPFQKDELFKWNVFEYADACLCLYSIETLLQITENKQTIWNHLRTFSQHLHSLSFYCVSLGYKTLLQHVIQTKSLEELNNLHKEEPLLNLALENHQLQIAEILVHYGCDLNQTDTDKNTALHKAAIWGHKEFVKLLLDKEVNVNCKNVVGKTPLQLAARMGHEDIIKILLDHGANVDEIDNENKTALHTAAFLGRLNIVKILHASGCNLHNINKNEKTALHRATKMGHFDTVKYLVENGLDIEAPDRFKCTALHYAAYEGRLKIVEYLLSRNANVFAKNENNKTPKQLARKKDFMQIVDILQKAEDESPIKITESVVTNVYEAAEEGDLEFIKKQYEKSKIPEKNILEVPNQKGDTLLHIATSCGHLEVVKFLLSENVSTSLRNRDGRIPLHLACYYGHTEIVKELIPRSKVSEVDKWGVTPLHRAIYNGHTEIVEHLLNAGANVNCSTFDETTPLHSTALGGHLQLMKSLIEKNADITKKTSRGSSCLHIAVSRRYLHVVKYLVETKKEILNDVDCSGDSAVFLAARRGYKDIIDILIAGGADINQKNDYGETALDAAYDAGRQEIVEYLQQLSKRRP